MLALSVPCNTALTAFVVVVALKLVRRAWRIINPVVRTKMFRMGQSTMGKKINDENAYFENG